MTDFTDYIKKTEVLLKDALNKEIDILKMIKEDGYISIGIYSHGVTTIEHFDNVRDLFHFACGLYVMKDKLTIKF